ncbi:MAG: FdtA/QdtA family cupin domain-containing protein [Bacteriovoracaceae bacterium]|nr:FdtA/QdtA family cupin domain-containing protein [Bacteriovoracaceae bacterium]
MANLIQLQSFSDYRGSLVAIDKILPFEMKRVYFIHGATTKRGGHRHIKTFQALLCPSGSCEIFVDSGTKEEVYLLDDPSKCLILDPSDWHTMDKFSKDCVLLVIASEHFDKDDYIAEKNHD